MAGPARPQNSVGHHPWLDEVVGILDGHLVKNLIALPSQLLNDVHVGGMKQAAASEPGGIDEVGGIDHQRVALPFTDRKPVVIAFDRLGARCGRRSGCRGIRCFHRRNRFV